MITHIKIPEKLQVKEIKKIAFFGGADIDQDHPVCRAVYDAARDLAQQGKIIVNGGGPGVMQAATAGAESVEGDTVVITLKPKDMSEFEGRANGNVADVEVETANYIERMFSLIYYADMFICVQGGTGTLSEWSTVWLMAHLYHGKHKPVILYGEFWHEVIDVIDKNFFIGKKEHEVFKIVTSKQELLQAVKEFEKEVRGR